jgi:hypothetical protein
LASCSLTVGGKTTTYTTCFSVDGGAKVYYSKSGSQLNVALTSPSTGWASWAYCPRGRMIGSSAVFAQSCGAKCAKAYTATMNGFSTAQFSSPGSIPFGAALAYRTSNGLATTFTMPWPGSQSSIPVMVTSGAMRAGKMRQHRGNPSLHTLSSALQQS